MHTRIGPTDQRDKVESGNMVRIGNLENGKVFEYAVHHVVLREIAQFVDETDHVITERGALNAVRE